MCIVDAYTSGTPQDNYGGASEMINQVHCPEKVHVQLYTYVHCPKNNLNFHITTEPVTHG